MSRARYVVSRVQLSPVTAFGLLKTGVPLVTGPSGPQFWNDLRNC